MRQNFKRDKMKKEESRRKKQEEKRNRRLHKKEAAPLSPEVSAHSGEMAEPPVSQDQSTS